MSSTPTLASPLFRVMTRGNALLRGRQHWHPVEAVTIERPRLCPTGACDLEDVNSMSTRSESSQESKSQALNAESALWALACHALLPQQRLTPSGLLAFFTSLNVLTSSSEHLHPPLRSRSSPTCWQVLLIERQEELRETC